jgi:hypothetical protein
MKLRSTRTHETFDAELTADHPDSIPGLLALKRKDTHAFIALRDVFTLPSRKFDILEATDEERRQLDESGIMLI